MKKLRERESQLKKWEGQEVKGINRGGRGSI
jgi:hypothetical protein